MQADLASTALATGAISASSEEATLTGAADAAGEETATAVPVSAEPAADILIATLFFKLSLTLV